MADPTTILGTKLKTWYDAEDESSLTLGAADAIQGVEDKGSNGNDLESFSGYGEPTYIRGAFRGKNVFSFSPGDALRKLGATVPDPSSTELHVWVTLVPKAINSGEHNAFWAMEGANINNDNAYLAITNPATSDDWQLAGEGAGGGTQFTRGGDPNTDELAHIRGRWDSTQCELFENGVSVGTAAGISPTLEDMYLGIFGSLDSFQGYIAEVVIADSPSAGEISDIDTYLDDKWTLNNNLVKRVRTHRATQTWPHPSLIEARSSGQRNRLFRRPGVPRFTDPRTILGDALEGWWDAKNERVFTFSSGSEVEQWDDKSPHLRHVEQASVNKQPTRQSMRSIDEKGLLFDNGEGDDLRSSSFSLSRDVVFWTAFELVEEDASASDVWLVLLYTNGTNFVGVRVFNEGSGVYVLQVIEQDGTAYGVKSTAIQTNTIYRVRGRVFDDAGSPKIEIKLGGELAVESTGGSADLSSVIVRMSDGGGDNYRIRLGEVVLAKDPTSQQITEMDEYMEEAWTPKILPMRSLFRQIREKIPPLQHVLARHSRTGPREIDPAPVYTLMARVASGWYPPVDAVHGRAVRIPPRPPEWLQYAQTLRQGYRIADDSLDVYELYVGEDQAPDFSASGQPVATSATLPFTWSPTPPSSGSTKTLHLVVRKRNAYDLVGFNVYATQIVIDSSGTELDGPVSTPFDVAAYEGADGYVRVVAKYLSSEDSAPADTWELYAKVGSDPVPGTDTPAVETSMTFLGDEAAIARELGPYDEGDVVHVIVTAKRGADDERASASAVQYTMPSSLSLSGGSLFGGTSYEQLESSGAEFSPPANMDAIRHRQLPTPPPHPFEMLGGSRRSFVLAPGVAPDPFLPPSTTRAYWNRWQHPAWLRGHVARMGGVAADVVSAFSPDDISDLGLWLDAADTGTVTESGGNATQIVSKEGNSYAFTVPTGSNAPAYGHHLTGDGRVLRCLEHDDANTEALFNAAFSGITDGSVQTAFVVATADIADTSNRWLIQSQDTGAGNHYSGVTFVGSTSPDEQRWQAADAAGASLGKLAEAWPVDEALVITGRSNTNSFRFRRDGIEGTEATSTENVNAPDEFTIGCNRVGTSGNQYWSGKVLAVLVYDRALTASEIAQVEGYLWKRYVNDTSASLMDKIDLTEWPGLEGWLDADDASTKTVVGGNVTQWDDKSDNGYSFTVPAGSNAPADSTHSLLSGATREAVLFDDANSELLGVSSPLIAEANDPVTVFVAWEPDDVSSTQRVFEMSESTEANLVNLIPATTTSRFNVKANGTNGTVASTEALAANNVSIFRGVQESSSSRRTSNDAAGEGTNTTSLTPSISLTHTFVGGRGFNSGQDMSGKLFEIIVFSRVLSDREIATIEAYLSAKWKHGYSYTQADLGDAAVGQVVDHVPTEAVLAGSSAKVTALRNRCPKGDVAAVTQATDANRPDLVSSGINSQPAILFDDAAGEILTAAGAPAGGRESAMWSVMETNDDTADQSPLHVSDGTTSESLEIQSGGASGDTLRVLKRASAGNGTATQGTISANTPHLLYGALESSSVVASSLDGAARTTASAGGYPTGLTTYDLGGRSSDGNVKMSGHIGRAGCFGRALSDDEISDIATATAAVWGHAAP